MAVLANSCCLGNGCLWWRSSRRPTSAGRPPRPDWLRAVACVPCETVELGQIEAPVLNERSSKRRVATNQKTNPIAEHRIRWEKCRLLFSNLDAFNYPMDSAGDNIA